MNCIVIIPARSGSKRIKNKNIKFFQKKPIISIVIKKLKKTKFFRNIYVSTDSIRIKKISEKNGAIVPFIRSKKLSNDKISSREVIIDMIKFLEKKKVKFDHILSVYPTSIFINKKLINHAFKLLKKNSDKFIFGAIPFQSSLERSFKLKKNKVYRPIKRKYLNKNSNDIEPSFYDSGQFYLAKKNNFKKRLSVFKKNNIAIIFKKNQCVDINDQEDWDLANAIYKNKL